MIGSKDRRIEGGKENCKIKKGEGGTPQEWDKQLNLIFHVLYDKLFSDLIDYRIEKFSNL